MRIIGLIRKHASLLAVLAVLAGFIAAPYLIPDNPDSPVFRHGTLAALLMIACYFPIKQALSSADGVTLASGMGTGFLFAIALSLGSELFVYDGLLPGMGSMVRRMAVPVLAAPLLGGLCTRLLAARICCKPCKRIPAWVFMLVLMVCWLPILLAYYPAALNYDLPEQFHQAASAQYSDYQPVLHTLMFSAAFRIGDLIGSRTTGMLLLSLSQMTLFAAALTYSLVFLQKRGAPRPAVLGLTALYALHPIFSVMSISTTKDTLFAAALLMLSLFVWEIIEDAPAFFRSKKRLLVFTLCAVLCALMRTNGIVVLAVTLVVLLAVLRHYRRQALMLSAACAAATALVLTIFSLTISPAKVPSFQFYSLPAQQLVRAYNNAPLPQADKEEIASWYISPEGLVIHPHLADSAKGYLDREKIAENGSGFLRLWARVAPHALHEYAEAFLMLNVGSWYPDDLSHATIYPDVSWNDKGYLQTQEFDMSEYGVESRCYLPQVKAFFERICRRNQHQKYPVLSVLFCTATPLWITFFACALLISRRAWRMLPSPLITICLWGSYLVFGPCTLPRYMLPLFCFAPALLILALCQNKTERD
ncbi:MAG: hypothetical protein IKU38_06665 [Clostridia bacterium]|nr:hypothetical protein [Clostridia bacterium]